MWGKAYRWAKGPRRAGVPPTVIKTDGGNVTKSPEETAKAFLGAVVPDKHRKIKSEAIKAN